MKILITGTAGFIGFHLSRNLLLKTNHEIHGIDNLNDYYSINLKKNRLKILKKHKKFIFKKISIENKLSISKIFNLNNFKIVIHLAAQAGVRYSFTNPEKYLISNIHAFNNIIELSRTNSVKNFFFASSSSESIL